MDILFIKALFTLLSAYQIVCFGAGTPSALSVQHAGPGGRGWSRLDPQWHT